MGTIDAIKEKIQTAAQDYPQIRNRIKNEKGMVYCINRISHMMKYDSCDFSGACAWLESELEGMD